MCPPDPSLYPLRTAVLSALLGRLHPATLGAITDLVGALLLAQSLHPADLARALPDLQTARARQAQRRVRRVLGRPSLSSRVLLPRLVRVVLLVVRDREVLLVLDSTRCVRREIFTVGVRCGGRVLPVAWALLPYPWPKGRFTPTVVALLDAVLDVWPRERAAHLVADRGFPSLTLFRCLECWRAQRTLGYTLRLRASDWVRPAHGPAVQVGDLEAAVGRGTWRSQPASYQHRGQAAPTAQLVIGRGLPLYPPHQIGPADRARRAERAARRSAHLASKGQPRAAASDGVWALLTTRATWLEAVRAYGGRFATEGTYRDLKAWDLAAVAAHETDPTHLAGLLGLASLALLVQSALGTAAGRAQDPTARARQAQWSTTDRLSPVWRGRQVLHDRAADWRPFLAQALRDLAALLQTPTPTRTAFPPATDPTAREAA